MMGKGKVAALYAEVLAHRMVEDRPEGAQGHAAAPQAPLQVYDTSGWLARELVARPLDYRSCQRLEALGVPGDFVNALNARCLIGAGRVQLSPDGERWDVPGPDARLLLAVTDGDLLADIAAVSTSAPDQVALRTGEAWCLGEEMLAEAEAQALGAGRRVTLAIVADPIEWLRRSGRAIWVLDWAAALPRLRGLGERVTLECDAGAGARIRALLEVGGLPKVKERAPVARAVLGEAA